ncbi:MAG: hypothetical protein M1813_003050 [Trichoglossum hirsutum]|nr:MAG: hypothetical protein M1813_003050 [Trichoglossum hirsutum]
MISHALRGASELNGRLICLPCFLEVSAVFRRYQLRNYAAKAQSQTAELRSQDGSDGAEPESLKTPEVIRTTNTTPSKGGKNSSEESGTGIKNKGKKVLDNAGAYPKKHRNTRRKGAPFSRALFTNSTTEKAPLSKGGPDPKKASQPVHDNVNAHSKTRRNTSRKGVPFSTALPMNSTIKEALLGGLARKGTSPDDIQVIDSSALDIQPVDVCPQPLVPNLSYGLERVLFNPGVYHLQDPRSRVYNFDPYLQSIMPIAEFDFDALKKYITSSQDGPLRSLASERSKKYTGSSSSTTGALAHFHFLLSQWREINTQCLSQGFPAKLKSFTVLQRSPAAIFLRWNGDSYAIDADKEFDSANILSMLGKSMEKLLTLPTHEFERYRKSGPGRISEEERNAPECFHYCTFGDFLLRSQLDAHDTRLPGTGMFDLKTRAVVSIRMNADNYHDGLGYEIRGRYGEWESYEREYFDMIRAAFLKYSLQVRMGRMDGIFVAFHNTERIFGFQYISLPEMDSTLHGTTDTTTGDREFKLSLELLNRVLDRATAKYPEKSLRIHFETRDAQTPFMYIFAEPVSEEQITEIQTTSKEKIEAFERNILGLSKGEKNGSNDEFEEAREESDSEWEHIQAKVEQELQDDENFSGNFIPSEGAPAGALKDNSNRPAESTGSASGLTGFASFHGAQCDQRAAVSEEDGEEVAAWDEKIRDQVRNGDGQEVSNNDTREEPSDRKESDGNKVGRVGSDELEEKILDGGGDEQAESGSQELDNKVPTASGLLSTSFQGEEDPKNLEDSEDEADKEWLEETVKEQQELVRQGDDRDLLAMTLSIRNKVNGRYVLRPDNLTERDSWTVEYSLAEVSTASRAWSLYGACQTRRKKALEANDANQGDVATNYYLRMIRELSKAGRSWRKKQDKIDAGTERVVLDQSIPKSQ